ncbi:hypothetical protein J437_LFUL012959 [Ladona fulva]|uniref:Galectin n=1 Tax=Ladona fulva TaxID=123851 RepID=A0A8K0KDZ5_LADFU|nr:hypothetical protein J437_LFUL012959 [Ladona fulva]
MRQFSVNLVCGIHTESDYAFHFNPRFERNFVIRNNKAAGRWGKENRSAPQRNPFKRGMPFHLYIFTAKDSFLVAVDGRHFCGFPFRGPISRVHSVHVHGDIKLFGIEHRDSDVYPVPGTGEECITIPVPTESCPATTTDEEMEVPFHGHLPNGLALGRQIEIIGRVKTLPHSFFINLQQGSQTYPSPEVALHVNPRFETDEYIVINSWLKKSGWGQEVRVGKKSLLFRPGCSFTLIISVQSDGYIISVNGKMLVVYKHCANPLHVDTVYVQGDVVLQHVYAR